MTLEGYIRAQMVRLAAEHGARYGGTSNMLGVAFVLRNRVFAGWGSWLEVVERAPKRLANVAPPIDEAGAVLRTGNGRIILARIDEIYSRPEIEDLTGGALFWVDPSIAIDPDFKKEVIDRPKDHPRSAQIGPVWFFK